MTAQLERLIQDSNQLSDYISKLQERGNIARVEKLTHKKQFLNDVIAEMQHLSTT